VGRLTLSPMEVGQRALAQRTSRRSFLGKVGKGVVALAGGSVVASALKPDRAEAYHVCGHTYTTGSCPHPFAPLTRVDRRGWPLHPTFGHPVDDSGKIFRDPQTQVRHKTCQQYVPMIYKFVNDPHYGGGWTRCCSGRLRHINDCCSSSKIRINGDYAVRGYCPRGKKVFCITYRELNKRC
jgi:hypothetical protein